MTPTYRIRPATNADTATVLDLRREAEHWLATHGVDQWTADYAGAVYPRWIAGVQQGISWVITTPDGHPVGHVALSPDSDPDFWLLQDSPDTGLYLGRLIVARAYAGHHLGDAILDWASRQAAQHDRRWLRLECRRDNTALQHYYLARGFEHVRTRKPPHRRTESGALFQRPAGAEYRPSDSPTITE